jgi:lysophospholipase L1-like esterase
MGETLEDPYARRVPVKVVHAGLAALAAMTLVLVAVAAIVPGGDVRVVFGVVTKSFACIQAPGSASAPDSTVGFGDSMTAGNSYAPLNILASDSYFDVLACEPGAPLTRVANRGIKGNTTSQMLRRLEVDVVNLHPKRALIVAGTNDVAAGDTRDSFRNLTAIHERLVTAGITPVYGTIPPNDKRTAATIAFNAELKRWAAGRNVELIDFFTPLATAEGKYKPGLTEDGTHPTKEAARLMADQARDFLSR